jgi:hypothetical protein
LNPDSNPDSNPDPKPDPKWKFRIRNTDNQVYG